MMFPLDKLDEEYLELYKVLLGALAQAQEGKGHQLHAGEGEYFENQIICEVARPPRAGLGYVIGQAVKKAYEAQGRVEKARKVAESGVRDPRDYTKGPPELLQAAVNELLGAINYLAAGVIVVERDYRALYVKEEKEDQAPSGPSTDTAEEKAQG